MLRERGNFHMARFLLLAIENRLTLRLATKLKIHLGTINCELYATVSRNISIDKSVNLLACPWFMCMCLGRACFYARRFSLHFIFFTLWNKLLPDTRLKKMTLCVNESRFLCDYISCLFGRWKWLICKRSDSRGHAGFWQLSERLGIIPRLTHF